MKGRMITLEGGEGAGKSTLVEGLRSYLQERGINAIFTREPGGTALGERVRELILDPALSGTCAESELLLMFAARAQLVRECIRPALDSGRWVVCDRFTDASYAYQGGGRGQPRERIAELERWAAEGLVPDLTLLLDLPVTMGRERTACRKGQADRIELEEAGFFARIHSTYLERAAAEPRRFRVLDASRPPHEVLEAAIAALGPLLEGARA